MTETVSSPPTSPASTPRRKRALWPWILLLLVMGGAAGAYLRFQRQQAAQEAWRWAKLPMNDSLARVPADWSAKTLAERMEKTRKINDKTAFLEAAEAVGLKTIAPGGYAVPKSADPRDLAKVFKAGPTHALLTFPEGFTGIQIAARLRKNGYPGADQLESMVYPPKGFSPYEGTLFPQTYWLPIRGNGKMLVAEMQEGFAQTLKKLPQPFPKVGDKELTTRELVTLASLIEREAGSRAEMPLVAGVLINRLREPMRLQVDAAIQYARILADKGHKSQLLYDDLKIDSPFNTYTNDGLPPTPICNPGEAALKAAARPAKTDALYYVYSPKLKKHRFARSYNEHLKNVRLLRLERDAAKS